MNVVRYLLFGIGVWLIPFALGMALFAVLDPTTPLFDTLMSVAMSFSAGWLALLYLRARPGNGFVVGLGWAVMAVALDAPTFLFSFSPALMPARDYFFDIGLTYAMIPLIAGFIGIALKR